MKVSTTHLTLLLALSFVPATASRVAANEPDTSASREAKAAVANSPADSAPNSTSTANGNGSDAAPKKPATATTAPRPSKPQAARGASEVPGITFGFDERLRYEGYNNGDFNSVKHDKTFQLRTRVRPYADFNFNDYFEGYVRMGWEGVKRTSDPSYPVAPNGAEQASPFMAGELWFDNAWIKIKKVPGVENLSAQVGRFEIVKGDGFLFSDPSGADGTREGYDNAVDLTYRMGNSKFELIGIYNPKYDEFFPVWNKAPIVDPTNPANAGPVKNYNPALVETGKQLQEWDQAAVGVYYTNREHKSTDFDLYTFFNKSYNDIRKQTWYMYLPDRHYTLFGGRMVHRLKQVPGLSLAGEFAYETGTENSMAVGIPNFDIRAWGGYGYAKKTFKVRFNPYVTAGFWALSGQDPKSRTVGNFDPLFQRAANTQLSGDAPSWSEFYIFSLGYEEGAYYWTNLKMAQAEAGFTPIKQLTVVGGYAHLDSMQPFAVNPYHAVGSVHPATPAAGVFGTGLGRGQLAKTKLIYRINPAVSGYISLEKFLPGDFYTPQNNGYWFRSEITYRFKTLVPFHKESQN